MSTAVDRRPSVDTRVGILPAQAPGLSRRDGAKVVEMFGGRDNLSEVERPATPLVEFQLPDLSDRPLFVQAEPGLTSQRVEPFHLIL